jgi:hypothetical protein
MEDGAARRIRARPQAAAMLLDDSAAEREPYAGAVRLGGEERLENAIRAFDRKSDAMVDVPDSRATVVQGFGSGHQAPPAIILFT